MWNLTLLSLLLSFVLCGTSFAAKDVAMRFPSATPMEVYTPNNPPPGGTVTSVAVTGNNGLTVSSSNTTTAANIVLGLGTINVPGVVVTGATTLNGDVGIGTSIPQGKLEISSASTLGTSPQLIVDNTFYGSKFVVQNNGQITISNATSSNGEVTLYVQNGSLADHGIVINDPINLYGSFLGPSGSDGTTVNSSGVVTAIDGAYYLNYWSSGDVSLAQGGGNVGIGTDRPSARLEINAVSGKPLMMLSSSRLTNGDYLIVTSSGNVGIGTTSPMLAAKLEVDGMIYVKASTPQVLFSDGAIYGYIGDDGPSAALDLGTFTNHPVRIETNNLVRAVFAADGNVGIGTLVPKALLEVDGNIYQQLRATTTTAAQRINGSIDNFLEVNIQNTSIGASAQSGFTATEDGGTDTTKFGWFGINNSGFSTPTAYNTGSAGDITLLGMDNNIYITNGMAGKNISFLTGGVGGANVRAIIDGLGNVGIGTTIPRAKLEVDGIMYAQGNVGIGTWLAGNGKLQIFGVATGTAIQMNGNIGIGTLIAGAARIQVYTAGATLPAIQTDGNIGISTTATGLGRVQIYTAGKTATAIQTDGNIGISTTPSLARIQIYSAASASTGLFLDGNIGVGSTKPQQKLEVDGNLYVQGTGSFVLMASPDGSYWKCAPINTTGVFTCAR